MKNRMLTLTLGLLFTLPLFVTVSAQGVGTETPIKARCADKNVYFQDLWDLIINKDDKATKESLLETNVLIAKRGFRVLNVSTFDYEYNFNKTQRFLIGFSREQFRTLEEAETAKLDVLEKIEALPGNQLQCSGIVRTQPSIGVTN